jgi:ribosomal protein L29
MAKVPAKDLREKTDQELLDQLNLEKKKIFDATVRGSSGEAIKPHEKRDGKRLIARIQTILRERSLRKELNTRIAGLEPRAAKASPAIAKRLAAGAFLRPSRAQRHRLAVTPEDRAALKLMEARRVRTALERPDAGETK